MTNLNKFSHSLRKCNRDEVDEILQDINHYLCNNVLHHKTDLIELSGSSGSLIGAIESYSSLSSQLSALKCLHQLVYFPAEKLQEIKLQTELILPHEVIATIQRVSVSILQQYSSSTSNSSIIEAQLLACCLSILYNLIMSVPDQILGSTVLKACYPFSCYGASWFQSTSAAEDIDDPNSSINSSSMSESENDTNKLSSYYTNRNRRKRLRRKRAQNSHSSLDMTLPTMSQNNIVISQSSCLPQSPEAVSLKPQWIKKTDDQKKITNHDDLISSTSRSLTTLVNNTRKSFCYNDEQLLAARIRVRKAALVAVNAVIEKVGGQNKFCFWPHLMCQKPTLMTCILKDPSPLVRMAALQVINSFLIDSQPVLSMAVDDDQSSSFTSLDKQLGISIRELHRCLVLALLSEKVCLPLVRILKTLESLMENVKYENLKPGLLTKAVTHVKYFLRCKEAFVRANAFSFMVSFLMIKPQLPEVTAILTKYQSRAPQSFPQSLAVRPPSPCEELIPGEEFDDLTSELGNLELPSDDSASDCETDGETTVSWIVRRCADALICESREPVPRIYVQVQLQSLKVLSALVSEHLILIRGSLPTIQHIIAVCCDPNSAPVLHFNTNETFDRFQEDEFFTQIHQETETSDPDGVIEHSFFLLGSLLASVKLSMERKEAASNAVIDSQLALELWLWALQHPLKHLLDKVHQNREADRVESSNCHLKSLVASANVLSHLCPCVMENIGETMLNQVLNTVEFLLHNEEFSLQLCGIRVMAIIVAYPALQEHIQGPKLVLRTIHICTQLLSRKHSLVNRERLLASWALANTFSLIAPYREMSKNIGSSSFLTGEIMATALRAAIDGCRDKDKIRPHSVRGVGNAVASLSPALLQERGMSALVDDAVSALIECSCNGKNMKMRWNACQALGLVLSNQDIDPLTAKWRVAVLSNLCTLMESFKNFKVRIQACFALACPKTRTIYGNEFFLVWKSLFKCLEDSQNAVKCQKTQHRDDLAIQLCVTLCHLIKLLEAPDAGRLPDALSFNQDAMKDLLNRAHQSLPPERCSCTLQAAQRIRQLLNSDTLTVEQERNLRLLESIFKESDIT